MGGDLNVGVKDYLLYDGFSYRFTPLANKISSTDPGRVDVLDLYDRIKNLYSWDAVKRTDYFVDYQNLYTFLGVLSQRQLYVTVANALMDAGEVLKAVEILDLCQENFPADVYPLETICIGFTGNDYMVAQMIEDYYYLMQPEKAHKLALAFGDQLLATAEFFRDWGALGKQEYEAAMRVLVYVADTCQEHGDTDLAKAIKEEVKILIGK